MFSTRNVGCFLNSFGGHGDDTETKELKLVFHVNPIPPDLAIEISPQLADRSEVSAASGSPRKKSRK